MIIEYHSRYLKAILDRARKVGLYGEPLKALEAVIRKRPKLTYVAVNKENKFMGSATLMELKDNCICCVHIDTKDYKNLIQLYKHIIKDSKKKSYDKLYRSGKINTMKERKL